MSTPSPAAVPVSTGRAFLNGLKSALTSVFVFVLFGTYIGIGALAHDFGFDLIWLTLSTLLVWAAPAQVILITALGVGTAPIAVALAVTLSAVRLLPMVVSLLPLIRNARTRNVHLILLAHFTAVSMWVESMRIAPKLPRENRVAFCNGLAVGYMGTAAVAGAAGFFLAAEVPPLLAAAMLFLTPMSFLVSVARNSRLVAERLALLLGLVLGPLLAWNKVGLELMWTGLIGGTIAYAVHQLREALR